jgi:hypothetical protein
MNDTPNPMKLARNSCGEPYACQAPWPESCFVQCGGKGVVISPAGNYRTAFFEAFPDTFIRGEGGTIEEAEASAWGIYQRQLACPGHDYARRGDSEHGTCRHCGRFQTDAFKPVHSCTICSKPHVNLDFYTARLCLEHFLELARDPLTNGVRFGSEEISPLYEPEELAQTYRERVWMAELLLALGLMPADIEDHLVDRYLRGKAFDLSFDQEQQAFLHRFYQEWIAQHSDQPIGGMQFIVLSGSFLAGEAEFKDVTIAALHAKGLVADGLPDTRVRALQAGAFELFASAAVEFKQRRAQLSPSQI